MFCSNPVTYSVKPGDTLYQLSRFYQTTVQAILALNPGIDPYNLKIGSMLTICPGNGFNGVQPPHNLPESDARINLTNDMRKAWVQHVYWTRLLIISIAERLKDQGYTAGRLLQNPENIADIFARFYKADASKTIEHLLAEHLQIGADLVTALRDRNPDARAISNQWYDNAERMADAFAGLSPNYDRGEIKNMLFRHLDLTTQEAANRLAGNYQADIMAFDDVETQALKMADSFTDAIIKDFPQKF